MQSLTVVAANLGAMALADGDTKTARTHLEQLARVGTRAVERPRRGRHPVRSLALVALVEGDTDEAGALLGGSLRLASSVGDREAIFGSLLGLAEVAARSGGPLHAARLLGAADALREEVGYGPPDPLEREARTRIANRPRRERPRTGRSPVGRRRDDPRRGDRVLGCRSSTVRRHPARRCRRL